MFLLSFMKLINIYGYLMINMTHRHIYIYYEIFICNIFLTVIGKFNIFKNY